MLKCHLQVTHADGTTAPAYEQVVYGLDLALAEAREARFRFPTEGTLVAILDAQDGARLLGWRRVDGAWAVA